MPAERLKFRCYRCNQLLAVAPSKAGTIVSCPKCQAELLIPGGETRTKGSNEFRAKAETDRPRKAESAAESRARAEATAILGASPAPAAPEPLPSVLGELAGVIPPDLADLRPEDLRVEAEFFKNLASAPTPAPAAPPAPALAPAPSPPSPVVPVPTPWPVSESMSSTFTTGLLSSLTSYRPETEPTRELAPPGPVPAPPEVVARDARPPAETPSPREEVGAIVPPIEIEPPSILPPGAEIHRVSEVVLPAPVVLAWSLFVLAGIAAAFTAGLMIGHYLWKIH
jgi:phage FluMu protein Com